MQKNVKKYDVLIIGAGPAGANAAISYKNLNYAQKKFKKPTMVQ